MALSACMDSAHVRMPVQSRCLGSTTRIPAARIPAARIPAAGTGLARHSPIRKQQLLGEGADLGQV